MHGWGGRGSQFGAMVEPLLESGHRVVLLDAPAHGDSEHGPAGPRRTNGLEFAKALDAVFARFGPAEAVVAHSLGTIATYLALRYGWLGTKRLVFIAPMVESQSLFDQFQRALGFGERIRRAFDRSVYEWVGIPVAEFDARFQAAQIEPLPTLVIADRGDRQTAYADAANFAERIGAAFMTTEGLGHRRILRDSTVINRLVDFVAGGVFTRGDRLTEVLSQPPMADIGRSGCRNVGSSMPWPGSLPRMAMTHRSAISLSLAPSRSAVRRSDSSRANRQLRTCPSAVSRTRSQSPQNGRVTEAMMPTVAGPPSTRNSSAGALPRGSSAGVEHVPGSRARPEDLVGGHHVLTGPPVLGVQRHLLDEPQLVAALHAPLAAARAPGRR